MAARIVRMDLRERRATVRIPIMDEFRMIDLAVAPVE
jgi:hypothetical protein